ncbi:MAG: hypothetical protein EOM23_01495, partial [Candidatus Moranbacteria bacterium]|nr:hypothetical protein [Candidatus Moranbacteria bacterium]
MITRKFLEVRTGRDSKKNADAMMEFFSTLPSLHENIFWQLIDQKETLSFEIVLENQNIVFFISAPERLLGYLQSLIGAHYPEATIKESTDSDFLSYYDKKSPHSYQKDKLSLAFASIKLSQNQCFPLKDYREFGEADSLSPLLARLSKANLQERAVIQFVVTAGNDLWKNSCQNIGVSAEGTPTSALGSLQKGLAESKSKEKSFLVNLNLAVVSNTSNSTDLFLTGLIDTLNSVKKEESNQFKKRIFNSPFLLLKNMQARRQLTSQAFHLTVYELATLYHFPNLTLSTIPNIAWGKNLIGEPPANLPIVSRNSDPEVKKSINVFAETLYKNEIQRYGIARIDRRRHMYVIGKTGTGKSTLLANMAINDLRNNEGLCFIDPHGDAIDILLNYIPASRINDVIYFNPADGERTVKINLFEGRNVEHRELIASGIVSIFHKLYEYSWGPRLEHFLRNALLTLLQMENAKLSNVVDLFTDKKIAVYKNLDTENILLTLIHKHNLDINPSDIIQAPADAVGAFRNDEFDILASYMVNEPVVLELADISVACFDPAEHGVDFYSGVFVTRPDIWEDMDNSGLSVENLVSFVKAVNKGWKYCKTNPDESIALMYSKYPDINVEWLISGKGPMSVQYPQSDFFDDDKPVESNIPEQKPNQYDLFNSDTPKHKQNNSETTVNIASRHFMDDSKND